MEQNTTLTLELSVDHVNIILAALSEGAFKTVQPVIQTIQTQATLQLNPEPAAPAVTDKAADKADAK